MAAEGKTLAEEHLLEKLQQSLPLSKSALVQATKAEADWRWKENWQKLAHSLRLKEIDNNFPCKTYTKICCLLPRHQVSQLIQLHTGHIPLNNYLHKQKLAPTNKCKKCQLQQCKTLQHFLFSCLAYQKEWVIMDQTHKNAKHNLKSILKDVQHMTALL